MRVVVAVFEDKGGFQLEVGEEKDGKVRSLSHVILAFICDGTDFSIECRKVEKVRKRCLMSSGLTCYRTKHDVQYS
jgi:hypothetical protein